MTLAERVTHPALRCVLQGIAGQIEQHLPDAVFVHIDLGKAI